jgi:hypothetical protein
MGGLMAPFQVRLITMLLVLPLALTAIATESQKATNENRAQTDLEKQKATVRDIRTIATAVEIYWVDMKAYPGPTRAAEEVGLFLRGKLDPTYVKNLPATDAWGRPFWYSSDGKAYSLVSWGKDGIPDAQKGGATNSFDCDIVFSNGAFFQWPSGTQT